MTTKANKNNKEMEYSKTQIKAADSLHYNIDLLEVLLEDDKMYTLKEVEALVNEFNNREVRF